MQFRHGMVEISVKIQVVMTYTSRDQTKGYMFGLPFY